MAPQTREDLLPSRTHSVDRTELGDVNLEATIGRLGEHGAWTSGTWDFGEEQVRRWNGIQNTWNDVKVLTSHLLRALTK